MNQQIQEFTILDIIDILRKRCKFIIFMTSLFFIGGILFGLYAPKKYESRSILSIGIIIGREIQSR